MKKHKISIESKTVDKVIAEVREFVSKIVAPAAEELGLLAKDSISYWRFKNQVSIIGKTKKICEERDIKVSAVAPKLLVPFMEHAALEDDAAMQTAWAQLLANLVNSEKNITNHVFPYILGQLSKEEYLAISDQYESGQESRGRAKQGDCATLGNLQR